MQRQISNMRRARKNLKPLKERLRDIRDRIEVKDRMTRGLGWKRAFLLTTAVGAIVKRIATSFLFHWFVLFITINKNGNAPDSFLQHS